MPMGEKAGRALGEPGTWATPPRHQKPLQTWATQPGLDDVASLTSAMSAIHFSMLPSKLLCHHPHALSCPSLSHPPSRLFSLEVGCGSSCFSSPKCYPLDRGQTLAPPLVKYQGTGAPSCLVTGSPLLSPPHLSLPLLQEDLRVDTFSIPREC